MTFYINQTDSNVENLTNSQREMTSLLSIQQAQIYSKMYGITEECSDTVPLEEGLKLFDPNLKLIPIMTENVKCVIDCILRKVSVVSTRESLKLGKIEFLGVYIFIDNRQWC